MKREVRKKYLSPEWKALRREVLERDGHCCQFCGRRAPLEVHHVVPVVERPDLFFDAGNLLTVCRGCHIKKDRSHKKARLPDNARSWYDWAIENTKGDGHGVRQPDAAQAAGRYR